MEKGKFACLCLSIAVVFSFVVVAAAQEVYVRTGFEEFAVGNPPDDWEVVGGQIEVNRDNVKTDDRSLAILGGADGDGLGVPIETENPVISVECWLYIAGGGRSFNLKVASADTIGENNGCTYINWDGEGVRLYDGAAWQPIGEFETEAWKYIRVIADCEKSEFSFAVGDDRNSALAAKAEEGLPFRNPALGPVAKWVVFYIWGATAPGYIDDLLVYEGAEPLNLAVDPTEKLAVSWGQLKQGR